MSTQTQRDPKRLMSWFLAPVDWVIAPDRTPRDDAELRRLEIITGAIGLILLLTVLTLPHTVVVGQALQLGTSGASVLVTAALLVAVRAGVSSFRVAHLLGGLISIVLFISALGEGGGILGHASIAYAILPVLLTLAVGGAHGWPWCGVSLVACTGLAFLTQGDPLRIQGQTLMAIIGCIVLTGCAYAFDSMRLRALVEANGAREQAEIAARRAEAATEIKSRFLANMSHEIRTPMNGVLGMLELLLETELGRTQQDYARTAHTSGVALLGLLNDILDVSKIEAGQMGLERTPFDLRVLMKELLAQVIVTAEAKGLELVVRFGPGTPTHVVGDRGRIRQIVLNLVSNAIKFTEHGHVHVVVEDCARPGDPPRVRCSVQDTGIGISAEQQALVFEHFRQVDMSSARAHEGTGLGLAIVRELVQLMGGEVGLESTPGQGSTFWFSVPLEVVETVSSKPLALLADDGSHSGSSTARILLVEDNRINQMVATRMLEGLGCHVDVASDGRIALAMVEASHYELVFMDIQMPQMDGLEACTEIRRREGGATPLPIVAMTAHAMAADRDRSFAVGMNDHISKPIGRHDLIRVLHEQGLWNADIEAPLTDQPHPDTARE